MTRSRTLLVALAAVCALALIVVIATLIGRHVVSRSASRQRHDAQRDTAHTIGPAASAPGDTFPDDTFNQPEPPPEPNVTGIVVDEDDEPVEGVCVSAHHLVPHLAMWLDTEDLGDRFDFGPELEYEVVDPDEDAFSSHGAFDSVVPTNEEEELKPGVPWGRFPGCATGKDGRFALRVCDELWYELVASKQGLVSPIRVFHEPLDDIRLVVYRPGPIAGRVVDADTGEPVTRFAVTLSDAGGGWGLDDDVRLAGIEERRITVEDESGAFRIDEDPRDWGNLKVQADGYVTISTQIQSLEGRMAPLSVRLFRSAHLTGEVVWEATGEPVTDTELLVMWPSHRTAIVPCIPSSCAQTCRTDSDGRFEFNGLPSGEVTVCVTEQRTPHFGLPRTIFEKKLTLAPSEPTHSVLRIPDALGSISGRVVDRDTGEPIVGAKLLLRYDYPLFDDSGEGKQESIVMTSDDNGGFAFAGVPPDLCRLEVTYERYAMVQEYSLSLTYGDAVEDLTVQLARLGRLEGQVMDASGKPVRASICCMPVKGETQAFSQIAGTDSEGTFTIEDVLSGLSLVTCHSRGHEIRRLVQVEPGCSTQADFVVHDAYAVSGTVTAGGVPIRGAEVYLLQDLVKADPSVGFIGSDDSDRTDDHGRFKIRRVLPSAYTLYVRHPMRERVLASMALEVVAADVDVECRLPTGTITGRVRNADTRKPIPFTTVSIQKKQDLDSPLASSVKAGRTDSVWANPLTGEYAFYALSDGRYSITASHEQHRVERAEVSVVDGTQVGNAELWLSRGCEVSCTITTTKTTAQLSRVTITVYSESQEAIATTRVRPSSERKAAVVASLPPGDYVFEADSAATAWQSVSYTVTEHGENVVSFCLTEGKALTVEVTDAAGEPVHGAIPSIKDALGRDRMWRAGDHRDRWKLSILSASDGKGITRIEHLLPGIYTLTVRAAGYEPAERQVEVLDTDKTRVKVVLERLRHE